MDAQALYQLFTSTLSPVEQTRKAAEEQLKQLSGQNGFLSQLLQIVASPETPGSVRQAAAIYFKNRVSRGWHLPLDQEGTISAEDRTVVRDHILQVVMSDVPTVRVQLIASLGTVVQNDFPESWPAFAPTILAQLQSSQSHEIHTGIVAMHELSRVYQWSAADRRVAFYEMAQVALPVMHKLATEFLAHDAPEAGEMVKVVVKTYTKTIRIELAPWLQQNDQLVPWATLLLQLVDKPIPVDASVDPEEREKQSWWKAKKWASKCFHLIMTRYARPKDSTYGAFGQAFIENFAPRVLTAYLHQVQICAQRTTWMSQRHMSGIADFLESCVRFTLLWKSMKPHLEVLLLHFVFPLMYFTDEDMELWENDPVEYVHKRIDPPPSDMSSPTHAAQILLMTLVEKRPKQTFQPIFRFIEAILSNQPPANLLQPGMVADETTLMRFRDGALNMLATIAEEIVPQNLSVLHLEAFIAKYVLPSCAAEVPAFMRSRAMATLTHFDEVAWTQAGTWQALLHYAMLGLQDAQLAVRVNAALLLTPFFLREDADDATVPGSAAQIHEVLGQHAPQIMRILLQIQNEIEMDTIAHIMEMLVNQYSEQLAPAAVELAEGLAQSFFQLVADLDLSDDAAQPLTYDQEEETEGKSMAALGTLSTMLALCSAVDNSPVIMQQMQNVLCPVIMAVLQKRLVDLFEQTFEIIDACIYTFKDVTPAMWSLLPLIHSACRAEEMVYFDEMTPALVSYVQYGGKAAAEHPQQHQQAMLQIYDLVEQIMRSDYDDTFPSMFQGAALLMEAFMMYMPGAIDELVPRLLDLVLHQIVPRADTEGEPNPDGTVAIRPRIEESNSIHILFLETVINALIYNPLLTLNHLQQREQLNFFLGRWFAHLDRFRRVHDRRLCILALTAILHLPLDQLPATLQQEYARLWEALVKVYEGLPAAIKNREEIEAEMERDDDDDEDDEDETGAANGAHLNGADDEDVEDEEDAYLDSLTRSGMRSWNGEGGTYGDDDDDDDEDYMLEEDPYYESPYDSIPLFSRFRETAAQLSARPDVANVVQHVLSTQTTVVNEIVKRADEEARKAAAKAAAAATTDASGAAAAAQ